MALPSGIQVFSGNLVALAIPLSSGTFDFVGLGQTATIAQNAGLVAASGISDNRVKQWVPGMATVSVSVTDMAVRHRSYEYLGLAPQASFLDLLSMTPFDIHILDLTSMPATAVTSKTTASLTPIKSIIGCLYSDGTLTINKHEPLTISATFNGLDVSGTLIASS